MQIRRTGFLPFLGVACTTGGRSGRPPHQSNVPGDDPCRSGTQTGLPVPVRPRGLNGNRVANVKPRPQRVKDRNSGNRSVVRRLDALVTYFSPTPPTYTRTHTSRDPSRPSHVPHLAYRTVSIGCSETEDQVSVSELDLCTGICSGTSLTGEQKDLSSD